jgi:FtsZ-binding cell division protein ZapB
MNPEITPEQQKQLDSWAAKRDSILAEIAVAEDTKSKLLSTNTNLTQSNTEIADKIQQGIGRIEEIEKKEEERKHLVSSELAELETKKTRLETTVTSLQGDVKELEDKKSSLLRDVANITGFHDHVFEKVNNLEGIVSKTIAISSENAKEIVSILQSAGAELKKVIDVGEANVEKTNKVIIELPKIVVDLHRDIMERRKINKVRVPQK